MAELDLVLETLKSSFPRRHRPRLPRLGCLKSSASDGDALYARQCPRVADGITYGEAIAAALMKEVNALRATQKVGGGVRPSIGVSGLRALLEQYSKSIPFEDPDAFATFDVDAWPDRDGVNSHAPKWNFAAHYHGTPVGVEANVNVHFTGRSKPPWPAGSGLRRGHRQA